MEDSFYHRGIKASTSQQPPGSFAAGLFLIFYLCGCASVSKIPQEPEQPPPLQQIQDSIEAGNPGSALQQYRDYLQAHPDFPVDRLLLARLLLAAGYPEEAHDELELLIGESGPSVEALLTLAYLERLYNNPDGERRLLERALEIDEGDPAVLAALGTLELEAGGYEEAERLFRRALEANPGEAAALHGLGVVLLHREEYGEAAGVLDRAVAADPGNSLNYADRARARAALKNTEAAIRDLSRAIELEPGFYWHYIDRGRLYLQLGRLEEAEPDFSRAIQIDPELFLPYVYRAGLYDRWDQRSRAIDDYQRILQLNPEYTFAHAPLAVLLYLEEDWQAAAEAFQQAYLYEEETPSYGLLAALSWMQLGEREKARAYLEQRLGDFPEDSWPAVIARYFLNPALEARTIEAASREQNKLVQRRMLFFIASALLLEDRVETALRYLLLVQEIDRPDLPEKRIAGQLLHGYGYED